MDFPKIRPFWTERPLKINPLVILFLLLLCFFWGFGPTSLRGEEILSYEIYPNNHPIFPFKLEFQEPIFLEKFSIDFPQISKIFFHFPANHQHLIYRPGGPYHLSLPLPKSETEIWFGVKKFLEDPNPVFRIFGKSRIEMGFFRGLSYLHSHLPPFEPRFYPFQLFFNLWSLENQPKKLFLPYFLGFKGPKGEGDRPTLEPFNTEYINWLIEFKDLNFQSSWPTYNVPQMRDFFTIQILKKEFPQEWSLGRWKNLFISQPDGNNPESISGWLLVLKAIEKRDSGENLKKLMLLEDSSNHSFLNSNRWTAQALLVQYFYGLSQKREFQKTLDFLLLGQNPDGSFKGNPYRSGFENTLWPVFTLAFMSGVVLF